MPLPKTKNLASMKTSASQRNEKRRQLERQVIPGRQNLQTEQMGRQATTERTRETRYERMESQTAWTTVMRLETFRIRPTFFEESHFPKEFENVSFRNGVREQREKRRQKTEDRKRERESEEQKREGRGLERKREGKRDKEKKKKKQRDQERQRKKKIF